MNRRDIFRTGFVAGLFSRLPFRASAAVPNLYERIGVRPIINCKGTYTIISGSQTLPQVKTAMENASRHYVHLDELMDGVGARLAQLTKAEWGIVTAGCAAALTHATAACIAGADPERMQRLPRLAGMKSEVVMPRQSRNVYDHAIRMLGVRIITPESRQEFIDALGPNTAMVALLGETIPQHRISLEEMTAEARKRSIPVVVDAAAERLTVPNVYLTKGADMVAYSGGKCLRGPQCAGVLLGRKDLLRAAWLNSAPHHAFGRSLKVGKEEIMGMLAAVEAWVLQRDHDLEWKEWEGWLGAIRERVSSVPTVRTEILMPRGPSNYAPQLRVSYSFAKIGVTGEELSNALLAGDPRVLIPGSPEVDEKGETSVTVMPYMMMPGDDRIAARRLYEVLLSPPRIDRSAPSGEAQLTGLWEVDLEFARGSAHHKLFLEQKGAVLTGNHRGETLEGEVRGKVTGSRARFSSWHGYEGTAIGYTFDGIQKGDTLTGAVDLGEYGTARFTARRHTA